MATITLTTSGITNPSSTTRAYKGYTGGARPPASAGNLTGLTEYTTTEYTNASSSNNVRVSKIEAQAYVGQQFEFFVPEANRNISQIDCGVEGYGFDGYADTYGFTLWIKNNNTGAWEQLANNTTAGTAATETTLTGQKTTNLSYYLDANFRVCLLVMNQGFDGNGSGAEMQVDYAYVTLTYTPSGGPVETHTRRHIFHR